MDAVNVTEVQKGQYLKGFAHLKSALQQSDRNANF